MPTGTVKWFSLEKGYGFITCIELKKDIFIHFENIAGEGFKFFKTSDKVEFETEETTKGTQALNARKIE